MSPSSQPTAPIPFLPPRTPSVRRALLAAALLAATLLAGCSLVGLRSPSGKAKVVGVETGARLSPSFPTRAYTNSDADTADIYLTDLSAEDLTALLENPGDPDVSGQLVHVHMFVRPKPGRTPIEPTAISATVRHVIVAGGQVGLYTGAGFMFPSGTPGDKVFGGSITRADLRLQRATPGFTDRLGPAEMTISFAAKRDEELSDELHRRIELLMLAARPVENAAHADAAP
jgi:hypothetical protein